MRHWHIRKLLAAAGVGVLIPGGLAATGLAMAASAATAAGAAHGTISTVVGGTGGPGPATNVSITPCALKYANGAVYFASGGVVDKVSQRTGTLTPVAGNGVEFGLDSGQPAAAFSFARPCGVALDAAGNVLVADGYEIEAVAARTGTFYGTAMKAGRVYTIATNFFGYPGSAGQGGPEMTGAVDVQSDVAGNLVIAVAGGQSSHTNVEGDSQVVVIAERTGTFYGQKMTKGKPYAIAGTINGYVPGNGVRATNVDLGYSIGTLRLDAAGNVVLAASGGLGGGGPLPPGPPVPPQVRVIAARAGTFYGQRMKADYIYTIAGGGTQTGNGVPATSERLNAAAAVTLDHAGNVLVADGALRVIAVTSGTLYGQKMRAGYSYTLPGLTRADGVAVDNLGNVLAASDSAMNIQLLAERAGSYYGKSVRAGKTYIIAGNGRIAYSGDGGPATSAELTPTTVAAYRSGELTAVPDTTARVVRVTAVQAGVFFGRSMRAGDIYTVAGTGAYGISGSGGPGTSAALGLPVGVSFDPNGNLLIADTGQHRVRVVANKTGSYYGQPMIAGHIYTVAGNGAFGISADGGPARAAALGGPEAVAADPAGNVLLIDSGWQLATGTTIRVRVVAARTGTFYGRKMTAGNIYTVAGNGKDGYSGDGGPATAAEIQAEGIAVDGSGNLVIADIQRVRVVAARTGTFYGQQMTAGDIYTVAGGGTLTADGTPALQAKLDAAIVAVDPPGNLLVGDWNTVWMVTERAGSSYGKAMHAGDVYTVASGTGSGGLLGDAGPATSARFDAVGIAVQPWNGNLLIADGVSNRVRSVER